MRPDDERIPESFKIADEIKMIYSFSGADMGSVHPNTVMLKLTGNKGRKLEIVASSLGGGMIEISRIDGLEVNFCADYPTLVVHNIDQPGHVSEVTSMLGHKSVNIAAMQLYRDKKGGNAVMVIECDQELPVDSISWLRKLEGVVKVTYLSLEEEDGF